MLGSQVAMTLDDMCAAGSECRGVQLDEALLRVAGSAYQWLLESAAQGAQGIPVPPHLCTQPVAIGMLSNALIRGMPVKINQPGDHAIEIARQAAAGRQSDTQHARHRKPAHLDDIVFNTHP